MKILLLQPPIEDFYDTQLRLQPIGLAYLKAALLKYLPGLQVKIIDFHHGWGRYTQAIPSELAYLKEYYAYPDKSPFSSFHQYYHFGASYVQIAITVTKENPDLVGISSLFSPYYREVLKTAEAIKKVHPVPIVVGGSHVSAAPFSVLEDPHVDFIIRGEGERPMVEFLKMWLGIPPFPFLKHPDWSRIPNLGYKIKGRAYLNPVGENYPLEGLPPPRLDDFSPGDYSFEGRPLTFMVTSRSCPHRCSFCSVHTTFGLNYRRHSVKKVLAEIRLRYEQGYRVIDFEDDNLTFYKEEMKELCRLLIRNFPNRDLRFLAMNGISYLSLDVELMQLMKAAGFTHLNLSLVTSDKTVRESTKRPHTLEKYIEVVEHGARLGFQMTSYQILGLPGESLESMIQTLSFGARLPVLLGASMFYLTPNSPIAQKLGMVASKEEIFKARLTAMAIESKNVSREDVFTLFVITRILDFLKGWHLKENPETTFDKILQDPVSKMFPHRTQIGLLILRELFRSGILQAYTATGMKPVKRFKSKLFFQLWRDLGWITTQEGKKIWVGENDRTKLGYTNI